MNRKAFPAIALTAALALGAPSAPAEAAPAPHFSSCAKMHHKYPHGVRVSKSAKDKYRRSGAVKYRATSASVNAKVYHANARLDADHDGVACETAR